MGSAGKGFKEALRLEKPLQLPGVINAYAALLGAQAGFKALYLSGAGVANAGFGLPDCGIITLTDICEETHRITACSDLPLLVDGDTGFGGRLNIRNMIKLLINAGASGVHIEDQVFPKRCGHRPGKQLVTKEEMVDRLKAAVDARTESDFVIMARTDAIASEGIQGALERAQAYVTAGADMVFAEAVTNLEDYRVFTEGLNVPVLANMTEFGQTPLFTVSDLQSVGVQLVLYPLSAFRAMSQAAIKTYQTIRQEGTQAKLIPLMQTREELYQILHYMDFERLL